MENLRDKAKASWADAQKIRSDIMAKISSLKKERGNANTTSHFEEAENVLAQLRLACMNAIFLDFEYATSKNVENTLWQTHTFLNAEYRKTTGRLTTQSQVVMRRKLEKQYRGFLKTSESFYFVYIQKLNERFQVPELKHIAQGTDFEPAFTTASDSDSTLPAPIRAMVLKSCQVTLVHLGDLVRYRFQMSDRHSDKPSNRSSTAHPSFEKALLYYGLASALDPNDGSAHNQMAVLHQLRREDLDIVYHFHRSLCVEKPHPLGMANIEQKFAGLENAPPPRRSHAQNPWGAMTTWFLRLHAFFFLGEPFSQQAELETEVLHRIELAVKSDTDEALLRKMIFINIAAYDLALEKVTKSWTIQGSQSAQFLLRFNIRTLLVLLRLLKAGLLDESATFPSSDNDSESQSIGGDESPVCFSGLLMRLLPLIRLYISWAFVFKADAEKYREFLEPHVSDVYRLLADTLTLLYVAVDKATTTTISSRYLLPEDAEALGLRPFSDKSLPLFVRTEELSSPKEDKARKPRQKVFGHQYLPQTEAIWRIRDILYCGILLAKAPTYPLLLTLTKHDGRYIECWSFTDDAPAHTLTKEIDVSRMLNKLKLGDVKVKAEKSAHKQPKLKPSHVDAAAPSGANLAAPSDVDIAGPSQHSNSVDPIDTKSRRRLDKGKSVMKQAPSSLLDTDLSTDRQMIDMVNKLVDPDQDNRPQSSQTHPDTSYGMNTTMANDIFGGLNTDSAQPSPAFKSFPNLSWNYFLGVDAPLTANDDYVPRSAHDQLDGFDSSLYLNNLDTPMSHAHQNATGGARPQALGPQRVSHQSNNSRDSLEMSRNAVLDSITSSLYAQHGLAPSKPQQPLTFANSMDANPMKPLRSTPATSASPYFPETSSPQLRNPGRTTTPNYMERSISQRTTASPHSIYATAGSRNQPRQNGNSQSRLSDILRDSSPDDDDEMECSAPGSQGRMRGRDACKNVAPGPPLPHGHSPWPQDSAKYEPLAFSHPSSLFGGTPAPPPDLPNMVFSNGNYYNASTPFGRLGQDYNSREDPTSFRNQLQSLVGDTTFDSYDKKVLESAFLDDNGKPAKK
ncbi:hypothetical protein Hte_011043 [Hypoxylon texense]